MDHMNKAIQLESLLGWMHNYVYAMSWAHHPDRSERQKRKSHKDAKRVWKEQRRKMRRLVSIEIDVEGLEAFRVKFDEFIDGVREQDKTFPPPYHSESPVFALRRLMEEIAVEEIKKSKWRRLAERKILKVGIYMLIIYLVLNFFKYEFFDIPRLIDECVSYDISLADCQYFYEGH